MQQYKITLACREADEARTIAGVLGEIVQPAPDAVTLFEDGAGWRVDGYFSEQEPNPDELARAIGAALGRPIDRPRPELLADENWVAMSQAALPPVHAGRFTIHGSHDRDRIARGPNAILIDAGEAFGTAHHATTLGCLLALNRLAARDGGRLRNVLDLGCGSGVLAIAAARMLPRARVLATDIDALAVEVAQGNIRINGAGSRVHAFRADGLSHPILRGRRFDLIIANILAGPLIAFAHGMVGTARPGGVVVLSGLLTPQAASVAAAYRAAGFSLTAHSRIAGWSALTLVRRPSRPCARARRAA